MTSIKEQLKTLFTEHNYNKSYKKDDIVTHTVGENIDFYVAKQNVPRFVSIHSKGYWKAINNIEVKGKPQPTPTPTPTPTGDVDYLCFTAEKAGATLRMVGQYTEGHENDFALEYSTDGETWQNLNFTSSEGSSISDTFTFENIGDKVYFRGDNVKGTTDINLMLQNEGYSFRFYGGEGTDWRDNEFSLSGDLQTIVDKTGQNKTAGCFVMLFGRSASDEGAYISVTTPPSCSATTLTPYCFYALFVSQTTLLTPMNVSNIDVDTNNADSFAVMYELCGFNITSDNGLTLNGFGNIEYPLDVSDFEVDTGFVNNNFDFAYMLLGNFNGFDNAKLTIIAEGSGSIDANAYSNSSGGGGSKNYYYWIPTNGSATVIMTATPDSGYHFVKWQTSNDEGSTWTDIPDATNATYTATLTQVGDYYYKAVFEQD